MKTSILAFSLIFCLNSYAQSDIDQELVEGKIEAQILIQNEEKLRSDYKKILSDNEKAIKLLNRVGFQSNERFSNPDEKAQVEMDLNGFLGRYQIVKQSVNDLERAYPHLDQQEIDQTLKNLNHLIRDLQNYLN